MRLFIVALLVFASDYIIPGSSYPSVSTPVLLTSSSASATIYSCFSSDNQASRRPTKEACCDSIVKVWQDNDNTNLFSGQTISSSSIYQQCVMEIAQVPSIGSDTTEQIENPDDTAKFSWVVSNTTKSAVKSTSIEQSLWKPGNRDQKELERKRVHTITPYHKTRLQPSIQNNFQPTPAIACKLDSHLGENGGMHRLFHHSFQLLGSPTTDYSTYFLYLTIPKGMFIDLDDPIEPTMGTIQSMPMEINDDFASNTSHSFVTTITTQPQNRKSSVLSFRARLHAAVVCDIEQPSFVSGQHLLIWEIDKILTANDNMPLVIEFASKVHLRYPHPSPSMVEWIDLPSPLLFAAVNSDSVVLNTVLGQNHGWGLGIAERVWVAAGKGEDHNWIMGMTICFCLFGVAIMLRDISKVSLWDDV